MISFHQFIGEGGKDGARQKFERLIAQLVRLQFRTVKRVEANPGDWAWTCSLARSTLDIAALQAAYRS